LNDFLSSCKFVTRRSYSQNMLLCKPGRRSGTCLELYTCLINVYFQKNLL
jgi:hypothetical protein